MGKWLASGGLIFGVTFVLPITIAVVSNYTPVVVAKAVNLF